MSLKKDFFLKRADNGFTLNELIITIAITGILTAIAIPVFSNLLSVYAIKSKAMNLYADLHLAKMRAIKENDSCRIEFLTDGSNSYKILAPDYSVIKTVALSPPDSNNTVKYGCGNAKKAATVSGRSIPDDGVSYTGNMATFNPMGLGKTGYIYLSNSKGAAYAVGTWASGVIVIKKWNEQKGEWVR